MKALDVLRADPRTDADRIAAIGHGTGGAIALELGRAGVNLGAIGTVNATSSVCSPSACLAKTLLASSDAGSSMLLRKAVA